MTQSEQELEQNLCDRLAAMDDEPVAIANADQLKTNLKIQLEKHNNVTLSNEDIIIKFDDHTGNL
jgi:type I restriction enzyme R subunit